MDYKKITNDLFRFLDGVKWFGLRKFYWILKRRIIWSKKILINAGILYPSYQQSLIKRSISRKLIEIYNGDDGHGLNYDQYFLGFGLIHYSFVRNLRPESILCIGSRKGFIPATIALACKDNGKGHIDFVDAGYDGTYPEKSWSGIGFWKKEDPDKHFAKIGVSDYITTYVMTTEKYASRFPKKQYQYIYIDGDHSYKGVRLDYRLFWPKLDTGCFMAFHDVVARGHLDKGLFGVWKFWKEIGDKHAIIFSFPKNSGLGIVQKL